MSEPAGIWVRVSTGGQDEQSQVPDCEKHCTSHGYQVARRYTIHGKSASKGAHQKDLDQMLADMKSGVIRCLVIWHSDRIERRPGKALLDLLAEVAGAGGRVESVKEPTLGQLDFGSQVTTFIAGLINHEKSRHLSEQVGIAFDAIKANGALQGRPPFGYNSEGEKYNRVMVPADVGRQYVPRIYQRVIDGDSLAAIGAWLDSEGVEPPLGGHWWPKSLAQLIRRTTYMGRRSDASGKTISKCEPLVDAATWKRANGALDTRPQRRHGGTDTGNRAMLAGVLWCPRCEDSPMYRVQCGKPANRTAYYRCSGRGAKRSGCGLMVRVDLADGAVHQIAAKTFYQPVMVTHTIPGHDHSAELEDIQQEMLDLVRQGLPAGQLVTRMAELAAEQDRLTALPSVPDTTITEPSGETYWQLWDKLTDAERGPWMKRHGFKVTADKAGVKLSQPGHPKQVTAAVTF